MKESHLDEGVVASGNNDVGAVFSIAYSVHIISMRPHPHSGLQAPQSVRLLQTQLRLAQDRQQVCVMLHSNTRDDQI